MKLTGLSLSNCIRDIIENRVKLEEVDCIECGTMMQTGEQFKKVIEIYKRNYWRTNPELAENVVLTLLLSNRIYQPRNDGLNPPSIGKGHWITKF